MAVDCGLTELHGVTAKSHLPGRLRLQDVSEEVNLPGALDVLLRNAVIDSYETSRINRSALIHYDAAHFSMERMLEALRDALAERRRAELQEGHDGERSRLVEQPFWELRSDLPERIRLRHPAIGHYPLVAQKVELTLVNLDGVRDYRVSGLTSGVLVHYDPERLQKADLIEELTEAVREVLRSGPLEPDTSLKQLSLSTTALALASTAVFVPALFPVAVVFTAMVATHIFVSASKAIFIEKTIKVDILDAIVIGLSLGFGHVFAAALMVWVVDLGHYLFASSAIESRKLLTKVFGKQTRKAWIIIDGAEVEVRVSEIQIGDHVVVRTGEQIPVDGVVIEGGAMVHQQALTGESAPAEKMEGDQVFAMTVIMAGTITVRAQEIGKNTNAAKSVRVIEESMEHKMRLQTRAEKFADNMVLPTLGLAAGGYMLAGRGSAIAIINSDFGTGIRVAAPIALMAFLFQAARHGIIIKNSAVLETLPDMDAVIFDKTGTLTDEIPAVGKVIASDTHFTEDEVLAFVASAEHRLTHPIARAIVEAAEGKGLELPFIDDSQCHIGFGIEVEVVDQGNLKVGSQRFMEREGVTIPQNIRKELANLHKEGKSAVFAAMNNRLIGIIEMHTSQRVEAIKVLETLRKRGIQHIYLISGDHEAATKAMAEKLGIDNYFAEVLPEDKAGYVRMLQDKGLKVAMVGDGINDAVALSQADYSISLRGADAVATDVADIVFMDGDLAKFDLLFEISDNLRRNIRHSFGLILVPNAICITGAMFGVMGLTTSLILNNGFNFLATINGMSPYFEAMAEEEAEERALLISSRTPNPTRSVEDASLTPHQVGGNQR